VAQADCLVARSAAARRSCCWPNEPGELSKEQCDDSAINSVVNITVIITIATRLNEFIASAPCYLLLLNEINICVLHFVNMRFLLPCTTRYFFDTITSVS